MEKFKKELTSPRHEGQKVVRVDFMYHDLECIGDGEGYIFLWVAEDEYLKFKEFNEKPWAQSIGVMINFRMPEFKKKVEDIVSGYAMDVFISDVSPYDPARDLDLLYDDGDLLYQFDEIYDNGEGKDFTFIRDGIEGRVTKTLIFVSDEEFAAFSKEEQDKLNRIGFINNLDGDSSEP